MLLCERHYFKICEQFSYICSRNPHLISKSYSQGCRTIEGAAFLQVYRGDS